MDAFTATNLLDLPNELILHILTSFSTQDLLNLATVSHRLHALVVRLILNRLIVAANPPDHTLLLECYHPSARLTEPALYCTYLRTLGLHPDLEYEQISSDDAPIGRLGQLRALYSSFRPQRKLPDSPSPPPQHPAGDVPGSRTHPSSSSSRAARLARFEEQAANDCVKQVLSLEGHELFTQLCAVANLVQPGPRRGLFGSIQPVEEGVVRVWREWLRMMAGMADDVDDGIPEAGSGAQAERQEVGSATKEVQKDERILWIDIKKNVGLKLKVTERHWRRDMPVLWSADEDDIAMSYEVEYQGMSRFHQITPLFQQIDSLEILVKTSHLLLMLEKSLSQQDNTSGKAIVFGSFA